MYRESTRTATRSACAPAAIIIIASVARAAAVLAAAAMTAGWCGRAIAEEAETPAPRLADLVDPAAKAARVATGFRFTEGPAARNDGLLLFSDIPNERIVQLEAGGTTRDFLKPSGRANGLVFDREGGLYACQGGARRIVRIDVKAVLAKGPDAARNAPGAITPLAESYGGKKLNSPNDLALDGRGGLYFTDPYYGRDREALEQPVMGVYFIAPSGKLTRVVDSLERPNGILVSSDGKRLYVAEPNRRQLYRFTIDAPGKLSGKKLIFTGDPDLDGGGPDGMALDERGNIYATYKGIVVLDPAGRLIGRLPVPERPANCTFGGKDRRTLFITARTSLYSIPMKVAGSPLRSPFGPRR